MKLKLKFGIFAFLFLTAGGYSVSLPITSHHIAFLTLGIVLKLSVFGFNIRLAYHTHKPHHTHRHTPQA